MSPLNDRTKRAIFIDKKRSLFDSPNLLQTNAKAVPWFDPSCVLRIYRVYVGTRVGTDDRKKRERMEDYVREKINEMLTVTRQPW